MKKKIFMACAALVVSAAAVVGVKAYNYYSMPELMRANLEALSQSEATSTANCYLHLMYGTIAEMAIFCNSQTSDNKIYPCPKDEEYGYKRSTAMDKCTKNK